MGLVYHLVLSRLTENRTETAVFSKNRNGFGFSKTENNRKPMESVFLSKLLESLDSGMDVPIVAIPRRPSSISNTGSASDQLIFIQLTYFK